MWTSEIETENQCLQINCNANNYNVGNISGLELVEKIKSIARENYINKYDIYDNTNRKISAVDAESGNFTGPLTIIRFNVAAA